MLFNSFQLTIAVSSFFFLAATSPLHATHQDQRVESRALVNCTDAAADFSTQCWDILDIAGYLNDPKTGWKTATPTCSPSTSDGSDCCLSGEAWSTCFLRLATGTSSYDCSSVNPARCSINFNPLSTSLSPSIAPQVHYVLVNIQAINQLFTNFYVAINSDTAGFTDLATILSGQTKVNTDNLGNALTAGVAFWGTPSVLAGGPQTTNETFDAALVEAFTQSVQQSQGVRSALWNWTYNASDTTTADPQNTGILTLGRRITGYNLQAALTLIMNDTETFVEFAAHGLYSGDVNPWKMPYYAGLTTAATTYAVGEALSQNQFSATRLATTTTKAAFQQGRQCTAFGDVCSDSKSNVYYWSSVTQVAYQIKFSGKFGPDLQDAEGSATTFSLLEYIETQTDAYMPVLFDGAYNCTLEGKAGGEVINFNANGTLDVACLSTVPIYLAKGSECPQGAVQVGGKCPFGFNS